MMKIMRNSWLATGVILALCSCKIESLANFQAEEFQDSRVWQNSLSTIPYREHVDHGPLEFEASLRQQLAFLSGSQLAGRRVGSKGSQLAQAHIIATFQELGLVPDGENRGWVQSVPLRMVETQQALIELEKHDGGANEIKEKNVAFSGLRHGHEFLLRRFTEAGQWNRRAAIVDVGYGIQSSSLGHDDYQGIDVRGKVVVVRSGAPKDDPRWMEAPYKELHELNHKLKVAKDAGALGCIVLTGLDPSSAEWNHLFQRWKQPFVQSLQRTQALPKQLQFAAIVAGDMERQLSTWLLRQQANRQVEEVKIGGKNNSSILKKSRSQHRRTAKPSLEEGSELPMVNISIQAEEQWFDDRNIIARLPGSEQPDQAVIVVAHYDAGGFATPSPQGGGLLNNATGVAMMTAIAVKSKRWASEGHLPKRSLLFVASAASTIGMWGAEKYVQAGLVRHDHVSAVVNLDNFSLGNHRPGIFVVDADRSNLQSQVNKAFSAPVDFVSSSAHEFASFDHVPFLREGMVAISVTDQVPAEFGGDPSLSPSTELQFDGAYSGENIQHLMDTTSGVFDLVWQFADGAESPSLVENSMVDVGKD